MIGIFFGCEILEVAPGSGLGRSSDVVDIPSH